MLKSALTVQNSNSKKQKKTITKVLVQGRAHAHEPPAARQPVATVLATCGHGLAVAVAQTTYRRPKSVFTKRQSVSQTDDVNLLITLTAFRPEKQCAHTFGSKDTSRLRVRSIAVHVRV